MDQAKKAYFVDGYHGGIKGHMPLGAWADVIRRLEQLPNWKLCLDIEPISWEALRRTDPRSYDLIKQHLTDKAGRVEMVAGSYAQPYGWVIGGESNIRYLIRGKEIVQEHFPGVLVDTYATQEPCWSSSYPQILRSLGYKRAVLKNPGTGWGGYASGTDHETVLWVGPDGTEIPCVPRYACEELLNCWESEAGYMKPEFMDKCISHGIANPVGSFLQDLGWTGVLGLTTRIRRRGFAKLGINCCYSSIMMPGYVPQREITGTNGHGRPARKAGCPSSLPMKSGIKRWTACIRNRVNLMAFAYLIRQA